MKINELKMANSSTDTSSELVFHLIKTIFSKWRAPKKKTDGTCRFMLDSLFSNTRNCECFGSILDAADKFVRWTQKGCVQRYPLVLYTMWLNLSFEAILPRISKGFETLITRNLSPPQLVVRPGIRSHVTKNR